MRIYGNPMARLQQISALPWLMCPGLLSGKLICQVCLLREVMM